MLESLTYMAEMICHASWHMTRRQHFVKLIQALLAEEGKRQPGAADWLKEQDRKRAQRRGPW